jgi:hypothetical protein
VLEQLVVNKATGSMILAAKIGKESEIHNLL